MAKRDLVKTTIDRTIKKKIEKRFVGNDKRFSNRSQALEHLILLGLKRSSELPKDASQLLLNELYEARVDRRKLAFVKLLHDYYKNSQINGQNIGLKECKEVADHFWNQDKHQEITQDDLSMAFLTQTHCS